MKLLRISDFFKIMAGVIEDRPQLQPPNMAAEILKKLPSNYQSQEMVNIGAGFVCWWRARPAQRFVWRYRDMTVRYAERKEEAGEGREPDRERLTLAPVIVSPYIRRHREKVIIVDAHDSHRWKRKEKAGWRIHSALLL